MSVSLVDGCCFLQFLSQADVDMDGKISMKEFMDEYKA